MNVLSLVARGGVIMWSILACAVLVASIVVERLILLQRAHSGVGQFMTKVKSLFGQGDVAGVLSFCAQKNEPVANVIRSGVKRHAQGEDRMRSALADAKREELFRMERRLPALMSMIGVAPMLGFLGTVTSLIRAFHAYELRNTVVSPAVLAAAAWESLLPTALGLCVGIVALGWYYYFVSRVRKFGHELDRYGAELLELFENRKPDGASVTTHTKPAASSPPRTFVFEEDQFFRRKTSQA